MMAHDESSPAMNDKSALASPARRKVIVVDDSELTLATTAAYLTTSCSYDVRTAASLAEFERQVAGWAPDIILTDESMPEVSGAALCHHLKNRADTAHVLVVLFSHLPDEELEVLAGRCGADGFCSKRHGMKRLGERIESLCEEVVW
jgi:DNA-binding NarL/FixJ family response regulator